MIEQSFLRRFSIYIVIVSLIFGILNYFKIQYQFYLWEIFIDFKIVLLFVSTVFFYKKKFILFSQDQTAILSFDWRKNTLLFFIPTLLYIISVSAGLVLNEITVNKLDNAMTLILASLFDIPAIYVFSVTSILIEEILFRGVLFTSIHQASSKISAAVYSSLIWTVFASSEIPGVEGLTVVSYSSYCCITLHLVFFYLHLWSDINQFGRDIQ